LLDPGLLPIGKVPHDVLESGKREAVAHRPLQISDGGYFLPEDLCPAQRRGNLENIGITGRSGLLTIW
jgi:hypothetical protein